jgi:F-type H+-transporting ATPase subunit b
MEGIGINLPLLVAFVVNFLILFVLLSVVLYKPVLKMLDARQAKIKESMDQADKIKLQLEKTEVEIKQQLESARKEGQKIIAQAEQIGERIKSETKDEARHEAELLISKARIEIQHQRDKDIEGLRSQFAAIAISAAEKVINQTLDKEKHRKLIGEVLEEAKFK